MLTAAIIYGAAIFAALIVLAAIGGAINGLILGIKDRIASRGRSNRIR